MNAKHLITLTFASAIIILSGCITEPNIDIDNIDGDVRGDNYILVNSIMEANLALLRNLDNDELITLVFSTFMTPADIFLHNIHAVLHIFENQNVRIRCKGDIGIRPDILSSMTDFTHIDNTQPNIAITPLHSRGASEFHGNGCAVHQFNMLPHIEVHKGATLTLERVGLTTNTNLNGYGGLLIHEGAHVMMNGGSLNNITFHLWSNSFRFAAVRMFSNSAFTSRGTAELNLTDPFSQAARPNVRGRHVNRSYASDVNAHVLPPPEDDFSGE